MQDFEKLGVFYLGKVINPKDGQLTDNLLLYESKNLTTHAVCVGMTGSGKTGLGVTLIEEAALDKIPAIIIDPKGDLGNLLLTFPTLASKDFAPWIDVGEAERKGMQSKAYAEEVAKKWQEGLAQWGETPERIKKLKSSVDMVIYTPASKAGVPLSIMSSFAAPPAELIQDTGALRDRVLSTTSSLLGLIGVEADPIKSREHILVSKIIDNSWKKGIDLDIAAIIQQVQRPQFNKIGVLEIDTFFPPKDRMALSVSLNNLLASPGFEAWMEGEPLDIQKLLYSDAGKPKLSIMSIAHLSNSERMFFVTLLLNEFLSWMRRQTGTSSLRAMLYMDEIFGFFPPIAMPPSKLPMLTLLKQGRAFGVGIVLATQNPVDLDYKGLANCGTWFIGKLQTQRDKARVLEGLSVASNGEIETRTLDRLMARTGNRIFIMRSVHEKEPILFETRWAMSYLRGPLTLAQIGMLTVKVSEKDSKKVAKIQEEAPLLNSKPIVPQGVGEFYIHPKTHQRAVRYKSSVLGIGKLHFIDAKNKIDLWKDISIIAPIEANGQSVRWKEGQEISKAKVQLEDIPIPQSTFEELPAGLMQEKNYPIFGKTFSTFLYQNITIQLHRARALNLTSYVDESEGDFCSRITLALREKRDELVAKLKDKYSAKITRISAKLQRAQEKIAQKQSQAGLKKVETWIDAGTTLLGALLGRGVGKGTISKAGTTLRKAEQVRRHGEEVTSAEEEYRIYQQQLEALRKEMDEEIDNISLTMDINTVKIESLTIRPRKSDISVEKIALVWHSDFVSKVSSHL